MDISNEEYLHRTNNLLERYHGIINQTLEFFQPKLSYLIHNNLTISLIIKEN